VSWPQRVLEVAVGGEGQVIGLVGDPGLGKSRLALEFCQLARPRAAVLEGRCQPYGASIAYLPLFDLVRNACGIAADAPPDLVGAKIERKVKSLELDVSLAHYLRHGFGVPAGDLALAAADPATIRARTFEALRRLLVALAGQRPLVVLIEDLHWIDQTSEEFLAGFVGELPSVPVMLLATYRPGYSPPWAGKSFTSQLALRPLSVTASERIVTSILAGGDRDAAAVIAERGEGNPFFLEELARTSRDHVPGEAGDTVPETVQQVLAARIDRLSADQKAAIQLAAVLGREFSLDLAAEIWDAPVPLEAQLLELKGLEFLRERHGPAERTFVFKHALTREVAYDGMLQARRRDLHGQAGTAVEHSQANRFEHCELLAYHYSRSGDPARAIPYLSVAADRAKNRYANEEAVGLYKEALSIVRDLPTGTDRDSQELAILEAMAAPLAARNGYAYTELQQTLERSIDLAESLGRRTSTIIGLVSLWGSRVVQGRAADAYQIANRTFALVEGSELVGQGHFALGGSAVGLGMPAEGLRHLELATKLAGKAVWLSIGTRADVHSTAWAAHAHWLLGHDAEALSACRQAIALARSIDHPFCLAVALAYGCITHQMRHDLSALREHVGELGELCDRYGFAFYREWPLILSGWSREDETGLDLAKRGIRNLRAQGALTRMPYWMSLLADLQARNNRLEDARATLDVALAAAQDHDDLWWLPEVLRLRAAYDEEQAAVSRLRQAAQMASAQGAVALLRRCERDLAERGVPPAAPGVVPLA